MWNPALQPLKTSPLRHVHQICQVVDLPERAPPIKSHDHLFTWSCEIMWETWNIVFPLPECLWAPNLVGWWLTLRSSYPWNYLGLWFRSLARSREKLKPIYLYYLNTYDHQTCQGGDLPWETPTHKVTYGPVITWSCKIMWQTKTIRYRYHDTYAHQVWQGGELPWKAFIQKVTWPFDHVVLRDHVTN